MAFRNKIWQMSQLQGQITTTQISPGAITTPLLAAGSVTTDKLVVVGTPANLLPDPSFETAAGAALVAAAGAPWVLDTTKGGNGSPTSLGINASAGAAMNWTLALAQNVPCLPGDQVYLGTDYAASSFTGNSFRIFAQYMTPTGSVTGYGALVWTPTADGTWRTVSGTYSAPANTTQASYYVQVFGATQVTGWFDNVVIRPQLGQTSIQAGAIHTAQLDAAAITSLTITACTINGSSFNGTNWIENSSGQFLYSAAPAAGKLIASIAPSSGTDAYGNTYLAGITTYDQVGQTYVSSGGGATTWGVMVSGVPQTTKASGINSGTSGAMSLFGPTTATAADAARLSLVAGNAGVVTGQPNIPHLAIADSAGTSAVDVWVSGTVVKANNAGANIGTWNVPTMASGWTAGSIQYELDPLDNVVWVGSVSNNAAATGSGGAVVTVAVAAQYRPKQAWQIPCTWLSSTSVCKGAGTVVFNTNGTLSVFWPASTAVGDVFSFSASIPLGNKA